MGFSLSNPPVIVVVPEGGSTVSTSRVATEGARALVFYYNQLLHLQILLVNNLLFIYTQYYAQCYILLLSLRIILNFQIIINFNKFLLIED